MTSTNKIVPGKSRTIPGWLDASLYPFEHRWVRIGGADAHYVDEGEGLPILFLHAAPAWSFIYREFVRDLRRDYRCIAVDFPGFGLSPAPPVELGLLEDYASFLVEFITTLDLRGVIVVVHDTSASIGLRAAAALTDRLTGVVLSDAVLWALDRDLIVGTMLRLVGSRAFGVVDDRLGLVIGSVVRRGPAGRRMTPGEARAYTSAFREPAARQRVRRMLSGLVRERTFMHGMERGLGQLADLPALVIFGEHDPIRRLGFHKRVASYFHRAEQVTIAGERHFPHEGAPMEMIRAMRSWLSRLPGDRR